MHPVYGIIILVCTLLYYKLSQGVRLDILLNTVHLYLPFSSNTKSKWAYQSLAISLITIDFEEIFEGDTSNKKNTQRGWLMLIHNIIIIEIRQIIFCYPWFKNPVRNVRSRIFGFPQIKSSICLPFKNLNLLS